MEFHQIKKMTNRSIIVVLVLLALMCFVVGQNIDTLFPPVASLKEEDEMDLRGMGYNETQVC